MTTTNDERFAGTDLEDAYREWLEVDQGGPQDRWLERSAAGCISEGMTVLTAPPEARYRVNAGYMGMPGWSMYYGRDADGELFPSRPVDVDVAYDLSEAWSICRAVEGQFFRSWAQGPRLKHWSAPYLERVS